MHCGAAATEQPATPAQRKHGCGYYLVIAGVVIAILSVIGELSRNAATKPLTPAEQAEKQRENLRAVIAARIAHQLQNAMRNPDSFKLAQVLMMDNGAVCYEYRAQNGFGGMNVGYAVLAPDGNFEMSENGKYQTLWDTECAGKTGKDWTSNVADASGVPALKP